MVDTPMHGDRTPSQTEELDPVFTLPLFLSFFFRFVSCLLDPIKSGH